MSDTKLVRVIERGFYNNAMVEPGTVFRVPATFKAKWVVDADSTPAAKEDAAKKPEEPTTLSEIANAVGRRKRPIGVLPHVPLTTE